MRRAYATAPISSYAYSFISSCFASLILATTALSTEGMDPQLTGTSGSDGTYTLDQVPPGSLFYVDATRPN